MAVQIGPKIGIEGEKEYRAQLQQIIQQTKTLDSEMKKQASTWDKNTSELTKNRAMAKNTAQQIALLGEKQEVLNSLLEAAKDKFGESSSAAQSYQRALNSTESTINNLNQQMKSFGGAEGFSTLSTKMADAGTKMQNMGQQLSSIGQKMTMSITLPLTAAGAASVKLASDLEESSSKVDVVFGNMSESVKEFAANALNSYGMAKGTAMEMAGTFGAMATSMGLSQRQAASMSTALTALAADMSSFYNVSTDVAQTSLQGVFTGETEALKKFGIVMTQTNLEDFAAKQGKVYSQMSEAEKVMTRYAFVMDATKDAQGDFARTSDGTANSMRVFKESLKELGAAFGEQLLPLITPVIQTITALIQKIASLPTPVQKFITVVLLLVAAVGPLILIIGTLMSSFGAIVTNAPLIISAVTGIAGAFSAMAASIGLAAPELLLIAAAIAAAVAGVVLIADQIAEHWDEISAAAQEMSQKVRNAIDKVMDVQDQLRNKVHSIVDTVVEAFKSLPGKIVDALQSAIQKIQQTFDNIVRAAKQSGQHMIEGFVDGIKEKVGKVVEAVKKVANTVKDFLGFSRPDKGPLHEYEEWMPHFMQGLAKGINANKGLVTNAINSLSKEMAIPLDANASLNMGLAGADGSSGMIGGFTMNVSVDHISELNDLLRIQNQAQQRYRMGAR